MVKGILVFECSRALLWSTESCWSTMVDRILLIYYGRPKLLLVLIFIISFSVLIIPFPRNCYNQIVTTIKGSVKKVWGMKWKFPFLCNFLLFCILLYFSCHNARNRKGQGWGGQQQLRSISAWYQRQTWQTTNIFSALSSK